MVRAHLTHVERIGTANWQATCDACDWTDTGNATKRDAVKAAEAHWMAAPLVSDVKMGDR